MQATNPVVQRAIDDCKECHAICVQTIQYSVQQGGPYVAPDYLRLLEDCAQLCQLSEDFMLRDSPISATICTAETEEILRRFTRNGVQHPTYAALLELG